MQIYLPIAEMSVNIFVILGLGGLIGLLSGVFGVGGGFLMTPLLIFYGVPPAVAVASGANQLTAASVSGALVHFRRGGVDVKMGLVLVAGAALGSFFGARLFLILARAGQVDLAIKLIYVVFLGAIGGLMLKESLAALRRRQRGEAPSPRRRRAGGWSHRLPFKMRFKKSRLVISPLAPIGIGFVAGLLAALMGIGGGFVIIPAMIYMLGMPSAVVVGTSLFQIAFTTASVTVFHAVNTHTVDVVLALLLLSGAVVGAQWGARLGAKLRAEEMRALLALMVLAVGLVMAVELVAPPADLFVVDEEVR